MKKEIKTIAGAIGALGAMGAQAGIGPVEWELCDGSESETFEGGDGCMFEATLRCDGEAADYGVLCVGGDFGGGSGSFGFYLGAGISDTQGSCSGYGVNVDSIGYMYQEGDPDNITKLEGKLTDSAKGPGKSWNKFGADQVTVEFELKALGGCD